MCLFSHPPSLFDSLPPTPITFTGNCDPNHLVGQTTLWTSQFSGPRGIKTSALASLTCCTYVCCRYDSSCAHEDITPHITSPFLVLPEVLYLDEHRVFLTEGFDPSSHILPSQRKCHGPASCKITAAPVNLPDQKTLGEYTYTPFSDSNKRTTVCARASVIRTTTEDSARQRPSRRRCDHAECGPYYPTWAPLPPNFSSG